MNRDSGILRRAFVASLPVMTGYLTMGFAAGMLLPLHAGVDLPALWAALTSGVFISGLLQFLLVDWVRSGTAFADVAVLVVCLNIRYSLYGISLLERYRCASWPVRLYLIGTVTDETYALQTQCPWEPGPASTRYCLFLAFFDHLYWIAGVTAGALAGALAQHLLSPEKVAVATKGIDYAMTALFIVILVDQCRARAGRLPALVGFGASSLAFCALAAWRGFAFAKDNLLIPSMVLIVLVFLALRRFLETPEAEVQTAEGAS